MMTRNERAKQFVAFDAMKGLSEALREKEKEQEVRENAPAAGRRGISDAEKRGSDKRRSPADRDVGERRGL